MRTATPIAHVVGQLNALMAQELLLSFLNRPNAPWNPREIQIPPREILSSENLGILIVDVDERYTGKLPTRDPNVNKMIAALNTLLKWGEKNCPDRIFVAEYVNCNPSLGNTVPIHKPTVGQIFEGTSMRSRCHVFGKPDHSPFHLTKLEDSLREKGIQTLIVGGINSLGCLGEGILDAVAYGFRVILPDDAHLQNKETYNTRFISAMELANHHLYKYLDGERFFTGISGVSDVLGLIDAAQLGEASYEKAKAALQKKLPDIVPACRVPAMA